MVNSPFSPLAAGKSVLVCDDEKNAEIQWNKDLKITVLHPNKKRLLNLQKQWDKDLKEAKKKGDNKIIYAAISSTADDSVFNLSSIVCLVELGGKTILLTGDALSDDILEGLKEQKCLDKNGKLHVNILKLPHHGSARNVSDELLQTVSADHYVISANGKYDNPDKATLERISAATKGRENFTVHLTNYEGENNINKMLDTFFAGEKKKKRTYKINYIAPGSTSIFIDLLDKAN
jgi:hypothetical protein